MSTIKRSSSGFLLLAALGFLACGCSPAAGPSKQELPIHRLQEVTDRAEVEKKALEVLPGAKPLPGDQGLVALEADGLLGVALGPEGWSKVPVKVNSPDYMTLLMSLPTKEKRYREPLMIKLREAVASRNGHAWTKPAMMMPFVLKVGGYDYLGQKVEAVSANGNKAVEYWLEFPREDKTIFIVAAGLPGFGAYFPGARLTEFLKQLPKVEDKPAASGTLATPATP